MLDTTLCYIEKDSKYLMLHRVKKDKDINKGKWIGVGGKFEEGETADECLIREVYEETGLTLTKFHMVGLIKFYSETDDIDMYLYKATDFTGEVKTDCSEGILEWVDKDKVLSLPTWEGDHYFLEPLLEGKTNLNMTLRYDHDVLIEFRDDTKPVKIHKSGIIESPHAFSTRIGGVSDSIYDSLNLGMNRGDSKARVTENFRRFFETAGIKNLAFVCGEQVHGNNVHIATKMDLRKAYGPGDLIVADGYVTNEKEVPLVIFTADCVPVLLEDKENNVVGAVHCGWKSTVKDIERNAIEKMKALGADVSKIHIAIGPAIDKCCFEVGKEVTEAVDKLLNSDASFFYDECENGKYMLDLRGVVRERFLQLGVLSENIETVGDCTMCHPDKYFSHRYTKGERGSLACVIELS